MIKPTNGRVVLFTPGPHFAGAHDRGVSLAALIAHVHGERCVNLAVFDSNGGHHAFTSVPLLQDDDPAPEGGYYAEWMPYQKGQAAKTEQLEQKLASQ